MAVVVAARPPIEAETPGLSLARGKSSAVRWVTVGVEAPQWNVGWKSLQRGARSEPDELGLGDSRVAGDRRDDLRATLDEIRAAGLHKPERVIGTPQSATVSVTATTMRRTPTVM